MKELWPSKDKLNFVLEILLKISIFVACYDKGHFWRQETPGSVPDTSDIYKQELLKEFFISMQKTPSQMQITFCTFHGKSKKKNLSVCNILDLALWIQIAFGETIPKRYNTWGLESYFILWVGGGCGSGWVAEHKTPSVIPFWNRLIKCSLNPKRKVTKITN